MTTTTSCSPAFTPESPPSGSSFASRLRRLSQLRTHHTHSPSPTQPRSNRYSLTRAVGLALSPHSPVFDNASDHLHHDLHPTISIQSAPESRGSNANRPRLQSSVAIGHPETSGSGSLSSSDEPSDVASHSSRSTQANEVEAQSSDVMRLRNVSSTEPSTAPLPSSQRDGSELVVESNTLATSESHSNGAAQRDPSRTIIDSSPGSAESIKPHARPTIRLFPHYAQLSRPSLSFTPITRTLPDEDCVIKVGRYSERDGVPVANPSKPSAAPVGFKSKVVSRKHCEFSFANGQWHIKDVGSSSGTFLNHMRLSQPNTPSRLYAVRDGDVVQLGIDFKGGEEMIFRCVRIRIECNRMWQRRPNEFNKNTESLINNLGKGSNADYKGCGECSICLNSVLRPYQCLFMAACAHVWHYKCIRRLIHTPEYPMFQCPNCRAYTDLSADVDDSVEMCDEIDNGPRNCRDQPATEDPFALIHSGTNRDSNPEHRQTNGQCLPGNRQSDSLDIVHTTQGLSPEVVIVANEEANQESDDSFPGNTHSTSTDEVSRSSNIDIPHRGPARTIDEATQSRLAASIDGSPVVRDTFEDCPLTPRNDLGPLALDGRAGRL
ncbi:hypothetical protein PRK78_006502 [Emydomyces testavorans]|uniref:FHA domain protein n=1 Tax=Emydomyces testavorans TaxID=2070801 RepID=A0AAF0DML7_9EURO|nr:hypothetical protein PRK78_006502 [Emydomyces testavorans]